MTTGTEPRGEPHPSAPGTKPPASWRMFFAQFSPGIRIGLLLGAVFYAACFAIAFCFEGWCLNVLLCLLGGVLGWFVGILGSPATNVQSEKFLEYRRALSAFVSGFLLARLDVLITHLDFAKVGDAYLLLGRSLLFAITFFAGLQFTFVTRLTDSRKDESPQPGE